MLALAGAALAFVVGEVEEGAALGSRAITLDPNLAAARYWGGWVHLYLGDVDAAIEQFEVASRLNPLDPRIFNVQTGLAYAHFFAGRNEEASTWATTALRQQPNYRTAQFILAACHAMSGRIEEAREICARLTQLNPPPRISRIQGQDPISQGARYRQIGAGFPDRGDAGMTVIGGETDIDPVIVDVCHGG